MKNDQGPEFSDEFETSFQLQAALDGDKGAIEWIWRWIASGNANTNDSQLWLSAVAKAVVDKVLVSPTTTERRQAALEAIGLDGKLDPYWALQRDLEVIESFQSLREDGEPDENAAPFTRAELVEFAKKRGHLRGKAKYASIKVVERIQAEKLQGKPRKAGRPKVRRRSKST